MNCTVKLVKGAKCRAYMGGYFQDGSAFPGIEPSPSFVRCPEGNVGVERYNPHWLLQWHGCRIPAKIGSRG